MFALEKQHLIPVPAFETAVPESIVTYQVRKDNTVVYHSNRYQVPFGTYRPGQRVRLLEQDGKLKITDPETREVYATHLMPAGKGNWCVSPIRKDAEDSVLEKYRCLRPQVRSMEEYLQAAEE